MENARDKTDGKTGTAGSRFQADVTVSCPGPSGVSRLEARPIRHGRDGPQLHGSCMGSLSAATCRAGMSIRAAPVSARRGAGSDQCWEVGKLWDGVRAVLSPGGQRSALSCVCSWCGDTDGAGGIRVPPCCCNRPMWGCSLQAARTHRAGLSSPSPPSGRAQGSHTQVSPWGAPGQLGRDGGWRCRAGRRETPPSATQPVLYLG